MEKDVLFLKRLYPVFCVHTCQILTLKKQRCAAWWLMVQHWPLTCSCKEWVRFPSELDTWHLYTPEIFLVTEVKDKEPLRTWEGWGAKVKGLTEKNSRKEDHETIEEKTERLAWHEYERNANFKVFKWNTASAICPTHFNFFMLLYPTIIFMPDNSWSRVAVGPTAESQRVPEQNLHESRWRLYEHGRS